MIAIKLDSFTRAYVECALWSSTDEDGEPLDSAYSVDDIAPDTLQAMIEDCQAFQADQSADLAEMSAEQAGHDFWLTRNRHGAGFWDRGLGDVGQRLTDAAHVWGSVDLYVGDDGRIYQ
jgi:hypothetical protein